MLCWSIIDTQEVAHNVYNLIGLNINALLNSVFQAPCYGVGEKIVIQIPFQVNTIVLHKWWTQEGMNLFLLKGLSWDNFHVTGMEIHLELAGRLIWNWFKNYESLSVTIMFSLKELCRLIVDTMLCFCVSICTCVWMRVHEISHTDVCFITEFLNRGIK